LLKKRNKKDKSLKRHYCICKTNDETRSMVKCDICQVWYHLDCLGYTEKDMALLEASPSFVCPLCIKKEMKQKRIQCHPVVYI
jgi:hypothetical protein